MAYATAITLHELTGMPTVVAFNAGNLLPVTEAYRQRHPAGPSTSPTAQRKPSGRGEGDTLAVPVTTAVRGVRHQIMLRSMERSCCHRHDARRVEGQRSICYA